MKVMDDLKEVLEDQLKKIAKKGDITPTELDSVYKATKTLKYIEDMKMSEEEGGMSNRGGSYNRGYSTHMPMGGYGAIWNRMGGYPDSYDDMSRDRGSYDRGNYNNSRDRGSYADNSNRGSYDGSYDDMSNDGNSNRGSYEGSFRRGRDARGRYTSRDGSYDYSRASKEEMVKQLEQMMNEASSEKERNALRQCLEKLEG